MGNPVVVLTPLAARQVERMENIERELAELAQHPDADRERRVLNQLHELIGEMKAAQVENTPGWRELERRTTTVRQ